jgi:hypothetical protein
VENSADCKHRANEVSMRDDAGRPDTPIDVPFMAAMTLAT